MPAIGSNVPVKVFAAYAFDTLASKLGKSPTSSLDEFAKVLATKESKDDEDTIDPNQHSPLFVTWNTLTSSEKQLRGCIGTFASTELESGVAEYALIAALQDTRFDPIVSKELPSLECAVTILVNFEDVPDPLDWTVGVHGVRAYFTSKNGRKYSSTFLPEVAEEWGWTREETLKQLARKAGCSLSSCEVKITRYQGHKGSITYDEYKAIKDTLDV